MTRPVRMNWPVAIDTTRDDATGELWVTLTFHQPDGTKIAYAYQREGVAFFLEGLKVALEIIETEGRSAN